MRPCRPFRDGRSTGLGVDGQGPYGGRPGRRHAGYNWGLVQLIALSDDGQLHDWLVGAPR
ncbi:hypothetical protein AQJ58_18260 [Streptomyces sp. DSM 15324]|nr:hypothetical protein AQJ58_18260 [Streptomyces sp. DSM 15324]